MSDEIGGDLDQQYPDHFVSSLEFSWGEGFLSPGGAEEIAALVGETDLSGKTILDIGSGISGVDMALVTNHNAAHVTGIDVEAGLVARGKELIKAAKLEDRVEAKLVSPGPLPFSDATFDVVFSKESLIHIPDKDMIYAEMYRVLRPGGHLIVGDWFGNGKPRSRAFNAYARAVGLSYALVTLDQAEITAQRAGFLETRTEDRNAWYQGEVKRELEMLQNAGFGDLQKLLGKEAALKRVKAVRLRHDVVMSGELRPGHLRARRT